ncbi:acyl-CoA dehydrogenase family protein [Natrarchaeobius chitinivorans]|uniref:Acyl-CoA dehydrogenase n=1 Tax=Natrarchaeobius chitinivorans TaxID=1679083 RepID=A0A3N6MIE4_NATCH|nr:acyl-CoA dehydrogenase family protein [Natrarchaeobius chitinivorans]RQG95431.1 acyl-CoA dehydrogenase [Natrarchaeobius chitinivorans]
MYDLTNEQRMMVNALDDLARNEFDEKAFTWSDEIPWRNLETLADHGFLGINFDPEYGGAGMSEYDALLMAEVVGRVCPDTARIFNIQHTVAPRQIDLFGTATAKEKYLPGVIDGESLVSVAISEPSAGSDIRSMSTTVEEVESGYRVDGQKTWISFGMAADAAVVWAKFDEGIGTVVVDLDKEGVELEAFTNMAGHTQAHYYFDGVRIPEENILLDGDELGGTQLKALNWERLGIATKCNFIAANALEQALEYAQNRTQFDQPIGDFQGIEWKLVEMVKQLEASRALTHQAARRAVEMDRFPTRMEASIAKLYAARMVDHVVDEAVQINGANGYVRGHELEYLYRLARLNRIAGGTDEIQRNSIATQLKKNGVPSVVPDS